MAVAGVPRRAINRSEITFTWQVYMANPTDGIFSDEILFRNNCNIRLTASRRGSRYLISGELLTPPTLRTKMFYRIGVLDPTNIEKVSVTGSFILLEVAFCFLQAFERESIKDCLLAEDCFRIQCSFVVEDHTGDAMKRLNALSYHSSHLRM